MCNWSHFVYFIKWLPRVHTAPKVVGYIRFLTSYFLILSPSKQNTTQLTHHLILSHSTIKSTYSFVINCDLWFNWLTLYMLQDQPCADQATLLTEMIVTVKQRIPSHDDSLLRYVKDSGISVLSCTAIRCVGTGAKNSSFFFCRFRL